MALLRARRWIAALLLLSLSALPSAQSADDPLIELERAMSAAESALRAGERQIAESRYRTALRESWMLVGGLKLADGQLAEARQAFENAAASAVDASLPLRSLALVQLQLGQAPEAVRILTRLTILHEKDTSLRQLLAQALMAADQPEQAVQQLEEARATVPQDDELAFLLASAYLRVKKIDAAAKLLDQLAKARPIAATHILIARTYRDFGQYDRARAALKTALTIDPKARRAHYYLGTIALMEEGVVRLPEATAEFRQELKLTPKEPFVNLRLGMALVEAREPEAALPHLEIAARAATVPADAFYYLGRSQIAVKRSKDAVGSLRKALDLTKGPAADPSRLSAIHYQLALASRDAGAPEEAAAHFAEAQRFSAREVDHARRTLSQYLADAPEAADEGTPRALIDATPFSSIPADRRADMLKRTYTVVARAYFNIGVMHAQAQRFARASALLERAAEADAGFPQLQYSLGVAYFNATRYDKAAPALEHALRATPADANVRRMLALAWLNAEAYDKAANLLQDDPRRDADPSLQYAYGLALVRSGRADEAQRTFSRLLAEHGNTPELSLVLGQAHAQQGDYDAAIQTLTRALEWKPDLPDANTTLGIIYLKQGKLADAETALRAELNTRPQDVRARQTLATVLELLGQSAEAVSLLRGALQVKPEFADARYSLGKLLLAQGSALEAVEHLEIALRLAPEDANIHYQLAQAYQKLGRTELARQRLEAYRQLKDQRRKP